MAKKPTRLPALTTLESIKEALDVRLGRRGDKLDAAVTFRDLEDSGAFRLVPRGGRTGSGGGNGLMPIPPEEGPEMPPWMGGGENPDTWVPPAPKGFAATAMFDGIFVEWDWPARYGIINHTEVYRATSNNAADRKLIAVVAGLTHFDTIDGADETEYFYWVRFRSVGDIVGPYTGPKSAVSIPKVGQIIDRIEGEISESVLTKALNERIDKIEPIALETAQNGVRLTELQYETEKGFAGLEENFQAVVDDVTGQLTSLYTLRVTHDGKITGFGLSNDGRTSTFNVLADRFVISGNRGQTSPFFVSGGNVYMRSALIQDATIDSAHIKNGAINSAKIRNASIDTAKISYAAITGAKIKRGEIQRAHIQRAAIGSAQIGRAAINTAHIGHAEVETLNLAGHAVTIPAGASFGRTPHSGGGWFTVGTAWLNLEGSTGNIILSGRWDGYASASHNPRNGNASATATMQMMIVAYEYTPYGTNTKNAGVIQALEDTDTESGGGNNEGGRASARVGGPVNFTWLLEDMRYNVKIELRVRLAGGPHGRGSTYGGFLGAIGAKR